MKKIFLAILILAAANVMSAQEKSKTKMKDDKVKYEATSTTVPVEIRTHFQTTHPTATVISWESTNDYWYATYKTDNNRLIHVYYNTQPWYLMRNENFIVALPVLSTFIPESVITSAIDKYGNDLYSITAMKTAPGAEGNYQVVLIKNGVSDRVMMNGEGVVMR
jgi:hypothetical protein